MFGPSVPLQKGKDIDVVIKEKTQKSSSYFLELNFFLEALCLESVPFYSHHNSRSTPLILRGDTGTINEGIVNRA